MVVILWHIMLSFASAILDFLGSRSDTEDWIDVAEMVREDRIIVKATGFFSRLGSFRMTSVGGAGELMTGKGQ